MDGIVFQLLCGRDRHFLGIFSRVGTLCSYPHKDERGGEASRVRVGLGLSLP